VPTLNFCYGLFPTAPQQQQLQKQMRVCGCNGIALRRYVAA